MCAFDIIGFWLIFLHYDLHGRWLVTFRKSLVCRNPFSFFIIVSHNVNTGTGNGMAKSLLDAVGLPCTASNATLAIIRGGELLGFWKKKTCSFCMVKFQLLFLSQLRLRSFVSCRAQASTRCSYYYTGAEQVF